MTIIETNTAQRLQSVAFDLYRDIHKGIRSELFAVVGEAGRVDPANDCDVEALADQVRRTTELLVQHAEHEDVSVQPALELHAPTLAEQIATDHSALDARLGWLVELAGDLRTADSRRTAVHEIYIELSAFTSAYLAHQDLEERQVSQALESALGVQGVLGLHASIIGNMAPQQLISGLAVMFPAMNVDDRTDLLGGMKANAPAEAFDGVWSLAKSVLSSDDSRAVATRLGIA
ncbi:MAG TPA: hemerythrin domain-containing protein [Ilumatobacteraceae bacterium]|nr:hemerythrin domain-containing protein [Ilumatobacteraceae bacterium]